jgi:hypothetical protein
MAALIDPICAIVFAGAGMAAIGTIVATVAPQYARIMRLAAQGMDTL